MASFSRAATFVSADIHAELIDALAVSRAQVLDQMTHLLFGFRREVTLHVDGPMASPSAPFTTCTARFQRSRCCGWPRRRAEGEDFVVERRRQMAALFRTR